MNKKFLGVRLGTLLTVILMLFFAVVFWLFAKYSLVGGAESECAFKFGCLSLL